MNMNEHEQRVESRQGRWVDRQTDMHVPKSRALGWIDRKCGWIRTLFVHYLGTVCSMRGNRAGNAE
jgi:hypothetical protein